MQRPSSPFTLKTHFAHHNNYSSPAYENPMFSTGKSYFTNIVGYEPDTDSENAYRTLAGSDKDHRQHFHLYNWPQNTKTRENIKQLRSSLDSLQRMIDKSREILKTSSSKVRPIFTSKSNLRGHQQTAKSALTTNNIKSDTINLRLRTDGSSIESRKQNKKNYQSIRIKQQARKYNKQTKSFYERAIEENNRLSKEQPQKDVRRKLQFDQNPCHPIPKTSLREATNLNEKPKHIMTLQKSPVKQKYIHSFKEQYPQLHEQYRTHNKTSSYLNDSSTHQKKKKYLRVYQKETANKYSSQEQTHNHNHNSRDKIFIREDYNTLGEPQQMSNPFQNKNRSHRSIYTALNNSTDYSFGHLRHLTCNDFNAQNSDSKYDSFTQSNNDRKKIKLKKYNRTLQDQPTNNYNVDFKIKSPPKVYQPTYFTGNTIPQYRATPRTTKIIFPSPKQGKYSFRPDKPFETPSKKSVNYLTTNYRTVSPRIDSSREGSPRKSLFDKGESRCKRHQKSDEKQKRQQFIKKVKKYGFVEKYLTEQEIGCIYQGLQGSEIPQHRWPLVVIDEVYKKMQSMKV